MLQGHCAKSSVTFLQSQQLLQLL